MFVALIVGALAVSQAPVVEHLGTVTFPTSCSTDAQPAIERGIALLHSFQYQEASQAFAEAARRDTSCAMCHWGKAMALYHQLWDWPNPAAFREALQEIARAERVGRRTAREQAYITATAAFFKPIRSVSHVDRIRAYSQSLERLYRDFPNDPEAAAFYALSLISLAGERVDDLPNLRQAISILTPLLQQHANHPGLAHYLIHAADRPELARLGLDAARLYADIAPDSSHALHMPSHIFARLGMWEETIDTNLRAAAAGKHAALEHRGDYTYQVHALDYVQYAYLQRGQGAKARALLDEFNDVPTASEHEMASDRLYSAAHAAVEEHRWADAAGLPIPTMDIVWLNDGYWARAIGAARSGDVSAARRALARLRDSLRARISNRQSSEAPIEQLQVEGWVAFAEGHTDQAVASLSRAADREDAESAEPIALPAREMLADLLFELKRPADALKTYERVLSASPRRFDALLGAARAAEALGATPQARDYYKQLLAVAGPDADRPELETARAYVAK